MKALSLSLGLVLLGLNAHSKMVSFALRNDGGFRANLTVSAMPQDVVIYTGPYIGVTQADRTFIEIDDSITQFKMHVGVVAGNPCEQIVALVKDSQSAVLTASGTTLSPWCNVEIQDNVHRPPTGPF